MALFALALWLSKGVAGEPTYFPKSTVKHWQLTGDFDSPRRIPTMTLTETHAGVIGTDLGSSFEHKGGLYFLFGDTVGRTGATDVMAWTRSTSPDAIDLNFHLAGDGLFLPIQVPGVSLRDYEVPSYGISVNDRMYIVVTTDHSPSQVMGRSVLAVSDDDGKTFQCLHDLSTTHFRNVALSRATRTRVPGLPAEDCVLIWGSGEYRSSSPRLACIEAEELGNRSALRYYRGSAGDGSPSWSVLESDAVPLFVHDVIGEFSVAWIAPLERWVMLYNSSSPRGIVLRTAQLPWGAWSPAQVIMEPWNDMGYGKFMHVSWTYQKHDTFHDPGREYEWGGEYGPYIIERFTKGDASRSTIFYTMSTWNPYQVVVMSSDIGFPDQRPPLETCSLVKTLPGDPGWAVSGTFSSPFLRNGVPHVTTWGPLGDAETGVAHHGFTFDGEDGYVVFTVHGGRAEVVLIRETRAPPDRIQDIATFYEQLKRGDFGPVVEAHSGPETNDVDVSVRWSLRRHAGHKLRLFVVDNLTSSWGFISVSQFTITEEVAAQPPQMNCLAEPIHLTTGAGCLADIPDLTTLVTSSDNCTASPSIRMSQDPKAGTHVPPGEHAVKIIATDDSGYSAECVVTVIVNDQTSPTIQCPEGIVVDCQGPEGAVTEFSVTGEHPCGLPVTIEASPPSGSLFPPGETTVRCVATTSTGGSASCEFIVKVSCTFGRQLPGDCTQDNSIDMSDAICLLGFLFLGVPKRLPCEDGGSTSPSNSALFSWNDDGAVDLSDAIGLLSWLFLGKAPQHTLGRECLPFRNCPPVCGLGEGI